MPAKQMMVEKRYFFHFLVILSITLLAGNILCTVHLTVSFLGSPAFNLEKKKRLKKNQIKIIAGNLPRSKEFRRDFLSHGFVAAAVY